MQVNTFGFKEFDAKLKALDGKTRSTMSAIVLDEAKNWEGLAKRSAPRNKIVGLGGTLVRGITSLRITELSAEVSVNARYAPYVEFGTGAKVSVPTGIEKYAMTFKGRKAVSGMRPQPYLFPHKPAIERSFFGRIQKYLNTPQ